MANVRVLLVLAGIVFCCQVLQAQTPGPAPSPSQIAVVSWVGTELNNMVSSHIDVFVSEGQGMIVSIAEVLFVWYLIIGLFSQSIRNELFVELILNFMIGNMMLTYYDAPLPWGNGITFHGLFAAEAQWAAATIDISAVNDVVKAMTDMWKGLELPHGFDFLGFIVYAGVLGNLALVWVFSSFITLIAHIALGFGALIGPLLIPFFIWPVLSWLFWSWVRFMITYALYIISSSAVVFIYANVITYFFTHLVNGNYTMGNLSAIILPFCAINLLFVIAFWQCHTWARDLASGSGSMGSNVSSAVQAVTMAVLA